MGEHQNVCSSNKLPPSDSHARITEGYANILDPVNQGTVVAVTSPTPIATVIADALRVVSLLSLPEL